MEGNHWETKAELDSIKMGIGETADDKVQWWACLLSVDQQRC